MRARRFVGAVLAALIGGCLSKTAGDSSSGHELDCGDPAAQCAADGDDADGNDGAAVAPDLRRVGRFDGTDPAEPTAEWSASAMETQFAGTSASVLLGGTGNYFEVVVDGAVQPMLTTDGSGTYAIASGLAAGMHDVLVFRRDEAEYGATAFLGFLFGAGAQAVVPPSPSRRIEVVGDSISAGFGDECPNANTTYTPATEDAYIAYGPVAARALGADVHVIAWSGKGMYQNLDGTTTDTMPVLWQRTIPTDPTSTWDPSLWVPDVVVVNLGTNDYFAPGPDPSADYETTYEQFVVTLRSAYPGAYVLCAIGPMLTDPQLSEQRAAVQAVIAAEQAAGDPRIALVEFPPQDCGSTGSGCGCDDHPNAATHQAMATLLEGAIQSALGW
jgi:lysophospholipase L1-like esterase